MLQNGKVQAVTQRKKEERERIQSEIVQQRDTWEKKRKIKIKREGGWSGKCWGGVLLDPPDPGPNGGKRTEYSYLAFPIRDSKKVRSRLFLSLKIDFILLSYVPICEARQLNRRTTCVNTSEIC